MFMYIVPLHFFSVHAGFGAAVVAGVVALVVAAVVWVVFAVVVADVVVDVATVVSSASLCLMALVGTFCSPTGAVVEYDNSEPLL